MNAPSTQSHDFFATCPRNTEGLLLDELRSLGANDAAETRAGVSFSGPLSLAYLTCLWSRLASRVLLRLRTFPISHLDDLYEAVRQASWEDHVAKDGTLAVDVTSVIARGPLADVNTHFAEQRVKDAVVDRFRDRTGSRPSVDLSRPDIRINVHLTPDGATVSLDLSGEALHRRGYRLEAGEAPLKENLAAAILLRAGWPRIAASGGGLVDPMCGSGTLLIEGAWMASDIAPGLLRDHFGFLGWRGFDSSVWSEMVEEARSRREQGLRSMPPAVGYDSDRKAVETARANARRAGLAGRLLLETGGLDTLQPPSSQDRSTGLLVTNPPYGKRLGDVQGLVSTYELLGERLKASFSGWEAAVFTGNVELGSHLGLRAHRVNTFFNGPLECRLLLFHIRGPADAPVPKGASAQALHRPEGGVIENAGAEMFANRLRKNQRHLRRWLAREDIHCYRLYDADLPEFALAVDIYENHAHVQEYAPPSTVDPVRARRRLRAALAVIPETLGIPPANVVLKVRSPQKGARQYTKLADMGDFMEVGEGGLRFLVNLTDYLDTGLFLDHRPTRSLIRDQVKGKRFLNLFAYTGSATVYAAAGGAVSTTSVDLSSTYLEWTRRNLKLNGFSDDRHSLVRADCGEWLAAHNDGQGAYDLIFMDAPTFSNSKRMDAPLDIRRHHSQLIRDAMCLVAKEGSLIFSTNFRRFRFDAGLETEFAVSDISRLTLPLDFARNPRIHRCFRITPP